MTRVLVDARSIVADPTGVGRYARALVPRLISMRPNWDWTILRHSSNAEPLFDGREVFVDEPIDGVGNYVRGGRTFAAAVKGDIDVLHSLFHLLPRGFTRPAHTIVTLHDLIWIDHPEISQSSRLGAWYTRRFAQTAIPKALRAANTVIAVSDATASAAERWIDRDRIRVIEHGVEPRFFDAVPPADPIVDFLCRDGHRYVAAIGNNKHYKNLHTIVRAFTRLDVPESRLVLIGRCEGVVALARELGLGDRVVAAGLLNDEDLRRVLGHASAFVFPSLVEGFGLPPIEAMALGVPTIVSNIEPMRSISSGAAMQFAPTDAEALAVLLGRILRDPELAQRMAVAGRKHARTFDWDRAASETLEVYETR